MKKKPILLVIDHFGSGGAQRQIVNIANGLVDRGEHVHIFIYYPEYKHYQHMLNKEVIIRTAQKRNKFGASVIFTLMKDLIRFKYKYSLVFLKTPAFYLELAKALSFSKVRVVYSERTSFELMGDSILDRMQRKLHSKCTYITSNSMVQSELLKNIYPQHSILYIPNAMPEALFQIPVDIKEKQQFTVLAHTTIYKNYDYLIDALIIYKKLFCKDPPTINWYGRVCDEIKLKVAIRRLEQYSLENLLIFHGQVTDVASVLKKTRFLVHPSKFESSSNSISESLSSGTPVLVGNISDHEKIISTSKAGFMFNLSCPSSLAKVLREALMLTCEDYNLLTKNARAYSKENFSSNKIVDSYHKILTD